MEELKGELSSCKIVMAGGLLAMQSAYCVKVPETNRSTKDVDNFLWGLEQYFKATNIRDDALKIRTASMYLTDITLL